MGATDKSRSENCDDTATEDIDVAVSSIELEDENGNTVRIVQQNAGPGNQVGQGEFKPVRPRKDIAEAAAEQAELERQMPIFEDHPEAGRDG